MAKIKELYTKYKEVIDYLFWGAVAFFLYMGLFWLFAQKWDWPEKTAVLIDNILVIIFAFFTNKLFVFRSHSESAKAFLKEFVEFGLARVFTLVLSELITWIGCDLMGFTTDSYHLPFVSDGMIVQLVGQVIVIVSNYVLSKLIVFRKKDK